MRKDTTEAKETSTTTIYHPSLLRYFLYIAGTSLVILFVLAWPFWRGDNFLERVVILWVAHVVVQLFFRFGIEMVSDKMIILSAGIIAGPQ